MAEIRCEHKILTMNESIKTVFVEQPLAEPVGLINDLSNAAGQSCVGSISLSVIVSNL